MFHQDPKSFNCPIKTWQFELFISLRKFRSKPHFQLFCGLSQNSTKCWQLGHLTSRNAKSVLPTSKIEDEVHKSFINL